MTDNRLKLEATAFNDRLSTRQSNDFIPDLKNYKDNNYFYKSFWRRKKYADIYVGIMAANYISSFSKFLNPGATILDFGCGPGYFSLELARCGFNVISYDIADKCIDSAQIYLDSLVGESELRNRIKYTSDLNDIQKYLYDGVLCSGVLHHLPNLNETLDFISQYFKDPSNALLVFHEPSHRSWSKTDAFVTAIIRLLLSHSGSWYEDIQVNKKEDLSQLVTDIFIEYTTERDPHEKGGQSPNDLSCDYDQIMLELSNRFVSLDTWPSRSFIYRTMGGLRGPTNIENSYADLLELIDKCGVEDGILQPNYMYGVARSLKQS